MTISFVIKKIEQFIDFLFKTLDKSFLFQVLLFTWYLTLNYLIIKEHILWRDDSRPILITFYSHTFVDLYNAIKYESTPMLYHFILWITNKILPVSVAVDKGVFFLINALTLFIIIFLLKIPNSFKLLLLLLAPQIGYLSYIRQYSITVLLIFLFAYLNTSNFKNGVFIYITLFLMSQTCFHGCLIAIAFFIFLTLNNYKTNKKIYYVGYFIVVLGIALCILQMIYPKDMIKGLYNVKPHDFSNASLFLIGFIFDVFLNDLLPSYAFYIFLWFTIKHFYTSNKFLTTLTLGCFGFLILAFTYAGLSGHSFDRHHWLLSYAMICFILILFDLIKPNFKRTNIVQYWLLFSIISTGATFYSKMHFVCSPMSTSKHAAYFIDNLIKNKLIIGRFEFFTDPILVYRKNIEPFYSLGRHEMINYTVWNHRKVDFCKYVHRMAFGLNTSEVIKDLNTTDSKILDKEPILVLGSDILVNNLKKDLTKIKIQEKYKLFLIGTFSGAITDNYKIYLIKRIDTTPLNFLNHKRPKYKTSIRKPHKRIKGKISMGANNENL